MNSKHHIYIYIYKSLPRWLRLVVNLGCWKNLVWSNKAAPSTNENKWWLPWALASTALWLLSTSYSYFKCWFIVMQNQTPSHPSFRMQYEWHSGHSQWMEKKMGMERRGKRRFLEWRWWLCHRQQLFDSSMCPFLPANLNKEKLERLSEEKSWRKISQEVTSNTWHLQKPSSESERLWRWSGPKTIYP